MISCTLHSSWACVRLRGKEMPKGLKVIYSKACAITCFFLLAPLLQFTEILSLILVARDGEREGMCSGVFQNVIQRPPVIIIAVHNNNKAKGGDF